jgi:phosphohistidine phosphatase
MRTLSLLRHGKAGHASLDPAVDDTLRPLTGKGRELAQAVARGLRLRGLIPAVLLSSPWLRAWETAEITARELGLPDPLRCPELVPSTPLPRLAARLEAEAPGELLLVGHEPQLSAFAEWLTGSEDLWLRKNGLIVIDCAGALSPGRCHLRELLEPEDLV